MNTETILRAYIECALWAETDNADESGGEPLDANYSADDIAPEALATLRADCETFAERARAAGFAITGYWSDEQLGHDLWLTRNGHGTGFWDRGLPDGEGLAEPPQRCAP
jgi:hypothetical protein